MSANVILAKHIDGLTSAKEILDLAASLDIKKITADQETLRQQMQLTAAEEAKVAEAKSWIAKHASLAADLKAREDALVAAHEAHANQVERHKSNSEAETLRLNNLAIDLNKAQIAVNAANQSHADFVTQLAKDRADLERQHRDVIAANNAVSLANTQTQAANAAEAQRLKDWEATLKAKAQKIREQAANF